MRAGFVEAEEMLIERQRVEEARYHEDALNLALLSDPVSQFTNFEDELYWGLKRGLQVIDPSVTSTMLARSLRVAGKEAWFNKQQGLSGSATVSGGERLLKVMLSMAAVRDRLQRRTDGMCYLSQSLSAPSFFLLLSPSRSQICTCLSLFCVLFYAYLCMWSNFSLSLYQQGKRRQAKLERAVLGLSAVENEGEEECDDVEDEQDDQYNKFLSKLCETYNI